MEKRLDFTNFNRGPGAAQSLDLGGQFGPLRAELSGAAEEGAAAVWKKKHGAEWIRRRMEDCGSDTFLEDCGRLMEYIYIYNYVYIYILFQQKKKGYHQFRSHLL